MKLREVYSSHVNKVGHDPATQELHVYWDSGKHSVYSGVDAKKAEGVMTAYSVGKAIKEQIKPSHEHRYAE